MLYSCVVGTLRRTLHYCIERCRTICFLLVQLTQHYWHAINPALPARYLLLRERYYAPIPYNSLETTKHGMFAIQEESRGVDQRRNFKAVLRKRRAII